MYSPSVCLALFVVGVVLMSSTNGFAQVLLPPTPSVPFSSPANPPALVPKENPAAKSLIADSLNQDGLASEAKSSGDPILDDVLGIIRRQGSVLDGSVLDPKAVEALPSTLFPSKDAGQGESFDRDSVYHAAEQLLRVSRMLKRLPSSSRDRDCDELISGMRRQAARMLIDAISEASQESHEKSPQASVSP